RTPTAPPSSATSSAAPPPSPPLDCASTRPRHNLAHPARLACSRPRYVDCATEVDLYALLYSLLALAGLVVLAAFAAMVVHQVRSTQHADLAAALGGHVQSSWLAFRRIVLPDGTFLEWWFADDEPVLRINVPFPGAPKWSHHLSSAPWSPVLSE